MIKRLVSTVIGLLAPAFIGGNSYAAVFFDMQQALESGYKANIAIPYDFNNDGKIDLITGDQSNGTISILLGNGDGTFQKIAENNLGGLSFAAADFNHDGNTDLAVLHGAWEAAWVSICLGNGDGTFQTIGSYGVGIGISSITTADFNDDNIPDFAVTGEDWGIGNFFFIVFLGNGDGTFQGVIRYGVGIYPSQISHSDLNNDGKEDIVVVNNDPNEPSISVYLGNGDGTFQASPTIFLGAWSYGAALTMGDYNRDGKSDLAVKFGTFAPWPGYSYVLILLGNGDGTFRNNASYTVAAASISTGDANGDTIPDLIIQNGDGVSVLLGEGNGTFPVQTKDVVAGSLLAITDLNSDRRADMAFVNSIGNLSTLLNKYGGEPLGSIVINNDEISTNSILVTLSLYAIDDRESVSQMRFSNDEVIWSEWEAYATSKRWNLTSGYGTKTVCVQFRDADNKVSPSSCDTIYLDPTTPSEVAQMIEDMVARGEISDSGVINAAVSLLSKAQVQYENDRASTKNMLVAAVNILEAQSGWRKKIDWQSAQKLIGYLNNIIEGL